MKASKIDFITNIPPNYYNKEYLIMVCTPSVIEAAIAFLRTIVCILLIKCSMTTTGHHTTVGQPNSSIVIQRILKQGNQLFFAFNRFLQIFSTFSSSSSLTLSSIILYIPDFQTNLVRIKRILSSSIELSSAPSFLVGDLVWLRKPSKFIPKISTKLCPRIYGPFKITESLDFNNYHLDLSNSPFPRRYDIFNVCELKPWSQSPNDLSNSLNISSILDCRINLSSSVCKYSTLGLILLLIDDDSSFSHILADFNSTLSNRSV
ncbi:hypothetical protein H8356DRAFT_1337546 [Neocallimastix lanati (nom. inval.)]|nr:hypothetical protein H8356DRAFT_1337546 [Neocallimastix sp. JGI-2020a]